MAAPLEPKEESDVVKEEGEEPKPAKQLCLANFMPAVAKVTQP